MLRRTLPCLALLSAAGIAAASDFLLGLNYTEWGPYIGTSQQIAADNSGALYILSYCTDTDNSTSCVTKLSADGKTIVWQNSLGFTAAGMAVDPNGGVYAMPSAPDGVPAGQFNLFVEKLSADGASVLWKTQINTTQAPGLYGAGLAVDSAGRVFVTGAGPLTSLIEGGAWVVRLNAAGALDATFPGVPGPPAGIAIDPAGSHLIVSIPAYPSYGFARLAPDSATWVTFTPPKATVLPALAVAPNGDAIIYGGDISGNRSLQRIDPTGAVVFSKAVPSLAPLGLTNGQARGAMVLDSAGNAYLTGYTGAFVSPVKNSLAPCGSAWLGVYAPDGSVLQTTYLPGATADVLFYGLIAMGPSSTVFVLDGADPTFTPIQTGPFPQFAYGAQYGSAALFRLSPDAHAPALRLACVGSAATYGTGAVAPGEVVTLFGNGLGPQQGVQLGATMQSPFPSQAASVQVTFDGTPAPLLWVQDSQINLAVPWSVTGQTTKVCVTYSSVHTNCLTWPVAQAAPGVFTLDGVHAAALNQDGAPNSASNPAPQDSIVSIYATGLGPIGPSQADGSLVGSPLPVNAFSLTLEQPCTVGFGLPCPVPPTFAAVYAGPAPLLIAGTSQINFHASDAIVDGGSSYLYLAVQTPSGVVASNYFRIYLAGVTNQ